jgi:hypothetical protein
MDSSELLQNIHTMILTGFSPQQHVIHKPNRAGTGQALKLQLRLDPKWVETKDGGFFDPESNKQGGLFAELAPQGPKVGDFPTFLWRDPDQVIRCKLGVPDITGLLTAIREYRECDHEVPLYLQANTDPKPNSAQFFHKFNSGSTIITYTFDEQQSIFRVSKGRDKARSISLTLGEELLFQAYLKLALDAHLRIGKR